VVLIPYMSESSVSLFMTFHKIVGKAYRWSNWRNLKVHFV